MSPVLERDPAVSVSQDSGKVEAAQPLNAIASLAQFCSILVLLWCVFFGVYTAFPYIRNGSEAIYRAKIQLLNRGVDSDLVIFGNSKVLTGFIPASFAGASGLSSFNLGLPDEKRFIANLEQLVAHGRAPRFVLLTMTDSVPEHPATPFHYFNNDRAIAETLFPFRHFPRDLTLFLLRSRTRGGTASFYRQSHGIVERMQAERGYYFIEAQSPYPDHRLPSGFHAATDRPQFVDARPALKPADLARLRSLSERHGIQIWFVPLYHRPGEYAVPPNVNAQLAAMVRGNSHFHLAGPDYWILPTEYFSDAVHLNPAGAKEYTRRLAALLVPIARH